MRRSSGDNLPTLALPVLAGSAGEVVDLSSLIFLTRSTLQLREEEEVQAMLEEVRDPDGWNEATGSDGVQFFWHRRTRRSVWVLPPSASRRKRKKRRKKKLPRSGRTRRRHRQWRVRHAGFAGSCAPRDVFPVADDWPLLLGNTAGMDQKDSFFVVVMAVAYARPSMLVGRPAGRSASWPVWTRRTVSSCRAENCGKSAVAVHQQGRLLPLCGAEADSHGLTVHADH